MEERKSNRERIEDLWKLFERESLYVNDIWQTSENRIVVEILWGDWKHEHARCDWLVSQHGGKPSGTMVTEEDGSDTYSAYHFYKF